jgi:ribA/ribD-fused uncharacterized protein
MTHQNDSMVWFWYGPMSNFWPCKFTENGIEYNCSEQYFMAHKAKLFNDTYTENEIMKVNSPKFQKRLGRTVANFNQSVWDSNCEVIMIRANRLKYSQNPELKQMLVNTGNKEIVEASPYDPNVEYKTKWKGENKLGKCLMVVRDELN